MLSFRTCLIVFIVAAIPSFAGALEGSTAPNAFAPEAVALEKLLTQYKELADNGGWMPWPMGKVIKAQQNDTRIPVLRQILTVMGDYQPLSGISTTSTHYDSEIMDAVKRFQLRHGLNADGVVSKSTQLALAVPVEKRITQILATLERMHTRPQPMEDKFVLVNLPAYTLFAIEKGTTKLSMRVIIGNRKNHTPMFDNIITDVVFNPQWHVPERIARNELVPKLHRQPAYFINAGFVVTRDGEPVDPMQVSPTDEGFSFRQLAGRSNALGKIKFNIPDSDDIYLHSTASPGLFAKEDRALSHGCIRLEKPRELAHFVMENADWNAKRIDSAYDTSRERDVKVESTPVHLVYWDAFVDTAGVAHFYNDVYGKDNAVTAQLHSERQIALAQ